MDNVNEIYSCNTFVVSFVSMHSNKYSVPLSVSFFILAGITAVIFDAGEYEYPCKLWYSIMESVSSYCTIKQWRSKRNGYFPSNSSQFDNYPDLNPHESHHFHIT